MNTTTRHDANLPMEAALSRGTWLLSDWLIRSFERLQREASYRRAEAQVGALADHQLRDLGIRRSDIPLVVRGVNTRRTGL